MAYQFEEYDTNLKMTCKAGTLASGADSTSTISLGGVNRNATADNFLDIEEAIAALISTPVLETLCVFRDVAVDLEAEVEG